MHTEQGHVLLVDDDDLVLRAYDRILGRQGWILATARDGREAKDRLDKEPFDVVVSDINMPGYGGLSFLQNVRERGLDIPVILVTGAPSVDTSIRAIEHGVFRYLVKPVASDVLVDVVSRAVRFHKLAKLKRRAMEIATTEQTWLGDHDALTKRFEKANELLWMAFQPIVSWRDRRVFGYEALLRSDEPSLRSPPDILEAAERLGKVHALGRSIRANVAESARTLPAEMSLFVNLHASDLTDDDLADTRAPLSASAARVVLEVTERASLDAITDVPLRIRALKGMGFRVAIDDLGAGYAGLSSLTQLEPEIAKLDMSLVRNIDTNPKKQAIVNSMRKLCTDLGMIVVAEGVETAAERDVLAELGCDLLQGYLFAKPARGLPTVVW